MCVCILYIYVASTSTAIRLAEFYFLNIVDDVFVGRKEKSGKTKDILVRNPTEMVLMLYYKAIYSSSINDANWPYDR